MEKRNKRKLLKQFINVGERKVFLHELSIGDSREYYTLLKQLLETFEELGIDINSMEEEDLNNTAEELKSSDIDTFIELINVVENMSDLLLTRVNDIAKEDWDYLSFGELISLNTKAGNISDGIKKN